MSTSLPISPIGAFVASVTPPGSKSLTNRALLLATLAQGESTLRGVLDADDTRRMSEALSALGFELTAQGDDVRVVGQAGRVPGGDVSLDLGNSGTSIRFLTAACCLGDGAVTLDGIERMRQRPIAELVQPLRQLGADISYVNEDGYPPLRVRGDKLTGGELTLSPTISSQFISALLMAAPYCQTPLTIQFDGPITSQPYVAMTLGLMARFGISAQVGPQFSHVTVPCGTYDAIDYDVEPDASNASYFLAAAAAVPGSRCTIEGLGKASLQGDVGFADVLHEMGAGLVYGRDFITVMSPAEDQMLRGIDVDLSPMPDMAQTLAAIAVIAEGPTTIRNVGNLRVKETDRLAALQTELTRLGAEVHIDGGDITITPPTDGGIRPTAIDTYDDHRMAMSFAVLGLARPGITINDPDCVAKTFPGFFEVLASLKDNPA